MLNQPCLCILNFASLQFTYVKQCKTNHRSQDHTFVAYTELLQSACSAYELGFVDVAAKIKAFTKC